MGKERDRAHCSKVFRCSLLSTTGGATRMEKHPHCTEAPFHSYWLLVRPHYTSSFGSAILPPIFSASAQRLFLASCTARFLEYCARYCALIPSRHVVRFSST